MKPISHLKGIISDEDQAIICPIRYLHNPLVLCSTHLSQNSLPFPWSQTAMPNLQPAQFVNINALGGALPYYSSIPAVYESKFWRDAMEASRTCLYLLSKDKSVADFPIRGGVTLSKLAKKELGPGFKHRAMRAAAYMYPFCISSRRLEIIAVLNVILFIFDDKFEHASENEMPAVISDFLRSLEGGRTAAPNTRKSPFQAYIGSIIDDIHTADQEAGNGGTEMVEEARKLFDNIPSVQSTDTLDQYLSFRRQHLCANWVFANVKFGLGSKVDIHQPIIQQFLTGAADHGSLVNDIYSYDKEAKAYRNGLVEDFVNIVPVLMRLHKHLTEREALSMAYKMVLEREHAMHEELSRFEQEECLDDETWVFLRAIWACIAGNTMYCMTSMRYGGEKARILGSMV